MPQFTPPTRTESVRGLALWSRFGSEVGQSVVRVNGVLTTHPYPSGSDLAGLVEGTDYFIGGYVYQVTEEVAAELEVLGFPITLLGFGEGAFGFGSLGG